MAATPSRFFKKAILASLRLNVAKKAILLTCSRFMLHVQCSNAMANGAMPRMKTYCAKKLADMLP
jgi:hypothetical protein